MKLLKIMMFFIGIFLVLKGQQIVGMQGLLTMLIGLIVLLIDLYMYNKKFN